MQPIDFVVHFSAMKHPNQWTILELTSNKCSHQKSQLSVPTGCLKKMFDV